MTFSTASPATTSRPPASAAKRVGAYLIDLLVVGTCSGLAWLFRPSLVLVGILSLEIVLVLMIALAARGRTPGLLAMKSAMIHDDSGTAPGLRRSLTHVLLFCLAQAALFVPLIVSLLVDNGRTWIDRISGTRVIDLAAEEAPGMMTVPPSPYASPNTAPGAPQTGARDGFAAIRPSADPLFPAPVPSADAGGASSDASGIPLPSAAPIPAAPPSNTAPPIHAAPPVSAASHIPDEDESPAELWAIMDSGERELLTTVIVIGRAPTSDDPRHRLVTVPDSTRSLSRTHVRIGRARRGAWVEDAFSANGTNAQLPDGRILPLPRGERRTVPPGTTLLMGERSLVLASSTDESAHHPH